MYIWLFSQYLVVLLLSLETIINSQFYWVFLTCDSYSFTMCRKALAAVIDTLIIQYMAFKSSWCAARGAPANCSLLFIILCTCSTAYYLCRCVLARSGLGLLREEGSVAWSSGYCQKGLYREQGQSCFLLFYLEQYICVFQFSVATCD